MSYHTWNTVTDYPLTFTATNSSFSISNSIKPSWTISYDRDWLLDFKKQVEKAQEIRKEQELKEKREYNAKIRGQITNVKFAEPWTIVWFSDGDIVRVKCSEEDTYSKEVGLAIAVTKHFFKTENNFKKVMKKWCE